MGLGPPGLPILDTGRFQISGADPPPHRQPGYPQQLSDRTEAESALSFLRFIHVCDLSVTT